MRKQIEVEPDVEQGAPEWMVTFSDCMTLLLTFFVLLLSFSSFSDKSDAKKCVVIHEGQASVSDKRKDDNEALASRDIVNHVKSNERGSEKPTLDEGKAANLNNGTNMADFQGKNVFIVPSEEIFWAKGYAISASGKNMLKNIANFFKQVNGNIIISENSPNSQGLKRAWAVVEYFNSQQMPTERFSITSISTLPQKNLGKSRNNDLTVEIVLLDRSVYN